MRKVKCTKFCVFISSIVASAVGLSLLGLVISSTSPLVDNHISSSLSSAQTKSNARVTPRPLSDVDVVITSQLLSNGAVDTDPIVDGDGNYILPGSNRSNNSAKVVKLSFQMQYLYDWSYNVSGYTTRQIVADMDDPSYYYALLVNENVTIAGTDTTDTANSLNFSLTNPALVVQLFDNGVNFEQKNIYQLQLPDFSINNKDTISSHLAPNSEQAPTDTSNDNLADNIWKHIYVEDAIKPEDTNKNLSFIRTTKEEKASSKVGAAPSTTTPAATDSNFVYVNDSTKSTIYKLLDRYSPTKNGSTDSASFSANDLGDYYILKKLYLNTANNMVYIKDPATNQKMILLFGGNAYQNFWFYDFKVNTNGSGSFGVLPLLYANYDFDPFNARSNSTERMYGSVNKSFFYLPFMKTNKVSNLAWYVGGAKTISIKNKQTGSSTPYVFLAMMQPNISDFNTSLYTSQTSSSTASSSETNHSVEKGTYGTPDKVSAFNKETCSSGSASGDSTSQNDNLQKGSCTKYDNKEILVGSSSINASFQVLSPSGFGGNTGNVGNFWYPFSAIESLTILPVMSSNIASLIAVDPSNPTESKIYLSSFFNGNNELQRMYRFSLFNCLNINGSFFKFDFSKKFIGTKPSWTMIPEGPVYAGGTNTGTLNAGNIIQGPDGYGFSRALSNINPKEEQTFTSLNDGWSNSASQKLIGFSVQTIPSTNEQYDPIVGMLVTRGYIYSFTYDFQEIIGLNNIPIPSSNFNNGSVISISSDTQHVSDFVNLSSITYADNSWLLAYQKDRKHLFYSLNYDPNSNFWSYSKNTALDVKNINNQDVNKVISNKNNSFFVIDTKNKKQEVNFITSASNNSTDVDTLLNGGTIAENSAVWGVVSSVDNNYLVDSDLISKTPKQIISDPLLLSQLITYTGGWSVDPITKLPTQKPLILNPRIENSEVVFDIALMYLNGVYYTSSSFDPSVYPNVVQDTSLATPTFNYGGFAPLEPWVLPVVVTVSVLLFGIILAIGIGIPLSIRRDKQILSKGFSSTNKKIDTLTTAVGSVYKKVIAQTKNNKQPQMLKSSSAKSKVAKPSAVNLKKAPAPKASPSPSSAPQGPKKSS
ncbi:hypothetical protein [Mycoplasmoides alvi]|uniref:hypothetical protein n=1 Tax=Mycoplasmoides alvi TaxID=78580 RepID=UPI00051B9022|nr:hypothetical protein [Mycoplasmoides alvi]